MVQSVLLSRRVLGPPSCVQGGDRDLFFFVLIPCYLVMSFDVLSGVRSFPAAFSLLGRVVLVVLVVLSIRLIVLSICL